MLKKLALVSFSILCLSLAYLAGTTRTEAQGGTSFAGISTDNANSTMAIAANGDVYARGGLPRENGWTIGDDSTPWAYRGNVLGSPISVESTSLGTIKGSYR